MITPFNTVAIVGVGLIGGSFGLALRDAGFDGTLLGVSSPAAVEAGLRMGAISHAATLEEAASAADLIYLAQHVDRILETIGILSQCVRPACLITDAGSTKVAIVEKAAAMLPNGSFLGGHPLAGKESRGVEVAESSLFRGRPYVLTYSDRDHPSFHAFANIVERIGARPVLMTASEHDKTVAFTSHLPQLLSTTLANTLAKCSGDYVEQVFGTGLLDMTRLAMSSPDLWTSILRTNKPEVTSAIDSFLSHLLEVREALQSDNLTTLFSTATTFARTIRKG